MTMGIVLVAFLAASDACVTERHNHGRLELCQLRREPGKLISLSLGEPNFNQDVSALNPTEIVKSLLKPIHIGLAMGGRSLV
jgi:hypothetical protein